MINLLPDKTKLNRVKEFAGLNGILLAAIVLSIINLVVVGFLGLRASDTHHDFLAKKTERDQLTKSVETDKASLLLYSYIIDRSGSLASLETERLQFDALLKRIAGSLPEKVQLSSLDLKPKEESGLSGKALTRTDITNFIANLSQTHDWPSLVLTQSNSQPEGVTFALKMGGENANPSPSPSLSP